MKNPTINYNVKVYHYIDNLEHLIDPKTIFPDCDDEIEEVKLAFKENGWEGDGEIKLIWIPPFVCEATNWITEGIYVWHVKQANNGDSFLAYKGDFPFYSDEDQNNIDNWDIEGDIKHFINSLKSFDTLLMTNFNNNSDPLFFVALNGLHSQIISDYNDMLNSLALRIFHYIFMSNNKVGLELNYKPKCTISVSEISQTKEKYGTGSGEGYFFSLIQIVQSLFDNFKFEEYKERFKVINSSFSYDSNAYRAFLMKHVQFRNSIQHNESVLTKDEYESIGEIPTILQDDGTSKTIRAWDLISLTKSEVKMLVSKLIDYSKELLISARAKFGINVGKAI